MKCKKIIRITTIVLIATSMILGMIPKVTISQNDINIKALTFASAAGVTIQNGDGISHSGTIIGNPIEPGMRMTMYENWPSGANEGRCAGAVFDGQYIWFPPIGSNSTQNSTKLVKMDKDTGAMTGYDGWPSGVLTNTGSTNFVGGVLEGENIWMIPYYASKVVKVNKNTGAMTGYDGWPSGISATDGAKFIGGTFDGQNIWMVPESTGKVVKINKNTGAMTAYNRWPSGTTVPTFSGAVFDGQKIWAIPSNADRVISIDKTTGVMTGYNSWPSGFVKSNAAFSGGVFDGQNIWMIPLSADRVIKINKDTGVMTGYKNWPSGFVKNGMAFAGGSFDGQNIWMIPRNADRVIKIDKDTGEMTGYKNWPSGFTKSTSTSFFGGVFDGNNVWMSPFTSSKVMRLSINNPPTILDNTKNGLKNTTMTFVPEDFTGVYADTENDPLTKIKIAALPDVSKGTLKLNGTAVQLNAEITAANLQNITFVPVTDWYGDAAFSWKANDYNDYSATAATMTLHISAQINQVTNVTLSSSGIASWDNVANESSFEVQLYKDGSPEGSPVFNTADTLSHDFLPAMRAAGVGVYTVKVTAKGDGGINYSDSTQSLESNGQTIIQLGTATTGLTWTGDVARWDEVANAVSYDVQLYKDGAEQGSSVIVLAANSARGVDFTSAISSSGSGTYTYKVTAKGNDTLILDGVQSGVSNNNVKVASSTVVTITAGKALGRPDKKPEYANVKIPFVIDSQSFSKNLTSYSFDVIYDPAKVGTVTVDSFNGLTKPAIRTPVQVADGSKEKVTVTWSGTFTGQDLNSIYNSSKGVLFKLNFVAQQDFTSGETAIEIGTGSFTFASGTSSITGTPGKIISGIIYGDVNGDGAITSSDTNLINKYVSGKTTAITDEVKKIAADANGDGSITAADAKEISNYISGKASTLNSLFGY